ncbi:cation efflux family-domain-containing protein [Cytidiella melzeri]|nr:cation efflux family-domain-containing protein [Cytidiella melzeri]
MDAADSRTRSKIILDTAGVKHRTALPQLALPNVFFVLALALTKAKLVFSDGDALWLTLRVLALGTTAAVIEAFVTGQWKRKSIEWPVVGFASFLLCLRLASLFFALSRLHTARVAILTHFSSVWLKSILDTSNKRPAILVSCGIIFSLVTDAGFATHSFGDIVPAYIAIGLEALSSSVSEHTRGVLLPELGPSMTDGVTIIGAFLMTSVLYLCNSLMLGFSANLSTHSFSTIIVPLVAYSLLHNSPLLARHLTASPTNREITISYIAMTASAVVLGFFVLSKGPRVSDIIVAGLMCYGMTSRKNPTAMQSPYASTSRVARAYLKSILENPESRKIFYFLVLNMCYMLVQMLYGIWTNSLGLISDAIHMAFDCMAIGVGLIASVMARWAPNEQFTYGYGRIETLSGFSNGIFLILISIFIVFEAIERLLDPPEMNTSQLLLVSTLGLCVNLFGMFAMGGHHHHGGHSHSHSHSHSPSPKPAATQQRPEAHAHGHGHTHETPSLRVEIAAASQQPSPHAHIHVVNTSPSDAHGDLQDDSHSHSPHATHSSHSLCDTPASPHSHSHLPSSSHSHVASEPSSHLLSHSHTSPSEHKQSPSHAHTDGQGKSSNGPSHAQPLLRPHDGHDSPITPNYRFEHDQHYEDHHAHNHGPNLHDHAHIHDHAHEGHSHNMRGVFLHVMADTLGSVGVIISTLLIQFYGWTGYDPIASLFIAILIAASVVPLVIDTGKVLMLDLSHRAPSINSALSSLHRVEGVESFSSARFWPKDDSTSIGSIHIRLSSSLSYTDAGGPQSTVQGKHTRLDQTVERVDAILRSTISGLEELTIQVEGSQ